MAEFLLKRNRKVTILEQSSQLGEGIPELPYKKKLMSWFVKKNVVVFTEIKYMEIDDRGITFFTKQDQEQTIKVDTIVLAVKRMPNDEPLLGFKEKAAEVYLIGDAKQPGLIGDAIADGFQIGKTI
jgi:pyruvate/2-oxoglutarate dehydrogenase complex dihydrolipoamide dehydrogenase (E3) component